MNPFISKLSFSCIVARMLDSPTIINDENAWLRYLGNLLKNNQCLEMPMKRPDIRQYLVKDVDRGDKFNILRRTTSTQPIFGWAFKEWLTFSEICEHTELFK